MEEGVLDGENAPPGDEPVPGASASRPLRVLVLLVVAGAVAASSVIRGLAPRFVPFEDPGFQARVGVVLVRTGFGGLAMVGAALVLLARPVRQRIDGVAGPLAAVLGVASLVTSGVGIAIHYEDARPWTRLEKALDEVQLPNTLQVVGEDHVDRLHDGAPGVRRVWAVPPTQGRDETCEQLREALAALRNGLPPEINPGRCDLFLRRPHHTMSAWLDTDRHPDRPTPAELREATRFVVIEVVAL